MPIILVLLNPDSRYGLYRARRVQGAELDRLEGAYFKLAAVAVQNPCLHPPYIGLRTLQKAFAGAEKVMVPAHLQVTVLRLEGDPYVADTDRVISWVDGHMTVDTLPATRDAPALWYDLPPLPRHSSRQ